MTTVWVDASAGASGDMLLGALVGAGVPVEVLQAAIDDVSPEPVTLRVETVHRAGFAATRVHVEVEDSAHHRTWRDVRAVLEGHDLAHRTFERLAVADCLVVVAGMEGALPSVVGGLTGVPLVAVPTSVGYGASFGGLSALLGMLNSCAPGVTVVNIDNGYGAGVFAARVARAAR